MTSFADDEDIADVLNEDYYYPGERVLISWHGVHGHFRDVTEPKLRCGEAIVPAIRPDGRPWTARAVHSAILDAAKDWPKPTLDDLATQLNWRARRGANFIVSKRGIGNLVAPGDWPDNLMFDETIVSSIRDDGAPWTGRLLGRELRA